METTNLCYEILVVCEVNLRVHRISWEAKGLYQGIGDPETIQSGYLLVYENSGTLLLNHSDQILQY